ncbi:TPT-domain-containing protein [Coniochaeta ligniaria NRRL 30616]|uniref:TPT-domain-containing protein n=1 Tax=Coniochaeta ligniaria NRRL 30616 TaxID=1408157 RepID=A0A1J7IQI3_9PEZI|nr:TPT-domain-containing protein [Coniochaeta ligniaria NRRL 30616]
MESQERPRMSISGDDDVERQGLTEKLLPPSSPEDAVRDAGVHPAFFIVSWIFFSNCTILLNKWLIDTAGFRYPILLTTWHLLFATLATQLLARTTTLLSARHSVPLTGRLYLRAVIPIGLVYSASLVCSNLTYLYLSVAFIQMLKAAAPVAVLFVAWVWGVENPTLRRVLNVCVVVLGVVLASVGEVAFSWTGVMYQIGGIGFEAMRLVMVQVLLSEDKGDGRKGASMDPLVGLYYFAPVCAVMNMLVAAMVEWPRFDPADVGRAGWGMLFLSGVVAFMLNVASVFVIGKTSGLAMCLTGILKNILLVIASVVIWKTAITPLQFVGYGIACFGLVYYSLGWEQMAVQSAAGWAYAKKAWEDESTTSIGLGNGISVSSSQVRRAVLFGLGLMTFGLLFYGLAPVSDQVAAVTKL